MLDDGKSHTALWGARSLTRGGWWIGSGSPQPSLVARSQFAQAWHRVDPPHLDFERFIAQIADAVDEYGYDLVIPTSDAEVLALSAARDQIAALVPYPPDDVVQRAFDKLELTRLAARVGLRAPITSLADADSWQTVELPVVVKCRLHWSPRSPSVLGHNPHSVCRTRDEVRAAVDAMVEGGAVPLLQEYLPGRVESIAVVLDLDGRLLGAGQMVAENLLRGANARAVTVEPHRPTVEKLAALLRTLGWSGLAQFDLVRDAGTGDLLPIDLNGRWFMSMAVFDPAGLDLAGLSAAVSTGTRPSPVPDARAGFRFQWLEASCLLGIRDRSLRELINAVRFQRKASHPYWVRGGRAAALRYDIRRLCGEIRDAVNDRD